MSVAWSTDQQEQFSCLCIGVIVIKINFYVGLPNLHPQIPQENNSYWEEPEHLPFPLFPALLAAMTSHPVKASTLGTPQLLQLLLDPHLSSTSIFWPSRVVRTHQKSKCVNHIPNSDISQLIQAWDYSISVPGEKKKKCVGFMVADPHVLQWLCTWISVPGRQSQSLKLPTAWPPEVPLLLEAGGQTQRTEVALCLHFVFWS